MFIQTSGPPAPWQPPERSCTAELVAIRVRFRRTDRHQFGVWRSGSGQGVGVGRGKALARAMRPSHSPEGLTMRRWVALSTSMMPKRGP